LSGLILAVVQLAGRLALAMAPSRLLSNLKDLRNDVIFLRADIDEGLRRYEILSEGETLPDAHQKELSDILKDINVIVYIHSNMDSLIRKMMEELPSPTDSEEVKQKKSKQIALLKDSYSLHEAKYREISSTFEVRLKKLNKKLGRVSAATEDWAGADTIRSSLAQELELVEKSEKYIKLKRQDIDYYLSNPEKVPQASRVPTEEHKTDASRNPDEPAADDVVLS